MLDLRSVTVAYGDYPAVVDVSASLHAGAIGCLVGPSGCGKTTLLRAIAGFLQPAAGEIRLDGQLVASPQGGLAPEQRRVGIVLQDLALFPHLSVTENIAFGLHELPKAERYRRVNELLDLIDLRELAHDYPHEISGGQQQRVAIARAMAPRPKLLLLDEPFSNLDPELREQLPRELRRIFQEDNITALLVTHDQHEAFAMADEIGVMRAGILEQWDTAYRLYHQPATRFVADFIGEGVMLPGTAVDRYRVETEIGLLGGRRELPCEPGELVDILLRPDDLLHDDASPLQARIVDRAFRGAHFLYTVALSSGQHVLCQADSHHNHQIGEAIGVRPEIDHLVAFRQSAEGG